METEIKTTPLHDWHLKNGANMAVFGGYDMPLWYPSGAKGEHLAVIGAAGLFDTSHMAAVIVSGNDAGVLLQRCFSKDLARCIGIKKGPLVPGRSVYGLFLTPEGHVLDDAIVSQVQDDSYLVVVNAGMGAAIAGHLEDNSPSLKVRVDDLTDRVGKMDIQGIHSAKLLSGIIKDPESVFSGLAYFSFKGWFTREPVGKTQVILKDGTPVLLSRTGYTGEFGFELFVDPARLVATWEMVLESGKNFGLQPCGLAARDSLRAGAVLPLSHQDIGHWPFAGTPWPFALADRSENGDFTKQFVGGDVLASRDPEQYTLPFAGYDPRKIAVSEKSHVLDGSGREVGTILTCTTDMAIDRVDGRIVSVATPVDSGRPENFNPRGLCCGFVKVDRSYEPGEELVLTDGKRKLKVEIRRDIRPDRTARRPIAELV